MRRRQESPSRRKLTGRVLALVLPALLLAACTAGGEEGAPEESGASATLAPVTYDQYQAAFSKFSACMSEAGHPVIVQGEENRTIEYVIPASAVQAGDDVTCYQENFASTDQAWQLQQLETSQSASQLRDCLTRLGVVPADSYEKMVDQLYADGRDPSACEQ